MHRFYLPPAACAGNTLRLTGREAHHAAHVLRLRGGEPVVVLDGAGNEFACETVNLTRDVVELRVVKKSLLPPPHCRITLLQALPRGKIIESIIPKAVELGVHRLVPLLTEHVVARLDDESAEHKREKWRQAAIEAIKQCGAAWLPEIEAPLAIAQFLARKEKPDLSLVGSLQKGRRHLREVFREFDSHYHRLPESVAAWIGPEGDFTPEELQWIRHSGAQPVSFGPLTLRVETAAIYCLAILNYELGGPAAPLVD